ncbi:hypothetical protein GIB67_020390, partial [Kingdonia uniflora]
RYIIKFELELFIPTVRTKSSLSYNLRQQRQSSSQSHFESSLNSIELNNDRSSDDLNNEILE